MNSSYIKKKHPARYYKTSLNRYKHTNRLDLIDGKSVKSTLNTWDLGILLSNPPSYYVFQEDDRIDIIATQYYGKASLYWIICYMNSIADPLNIPVGTILQLPKLEDLFNYPNPLS